MDLDMRGLLLDLNKQIDEVEAIEEVFRNPKSMIQSFKLVGPTSRLSDSGRHWLKASVSTSESKTCADSDDLHIESRFVVEGIHGLLSCRHFMLWHLGQWTVEMLKGLIVGNFDNN